METALENSVWVTSPEFAGWLVKRGFRWRKLWTKRWVALHGTEIAYMAAEPTDSTKDMVITKSQILPSTVINRDDIEGHPHGFAIHINDGSTPVWYLRAESTREKKSWLMRLGHVQEIIKWLDNFEKTKVLGVGATGIVYELKHKQNGRRYALKEMEIKNKAQMQMALSEAEMLKEIMENISHPNIMHIDKVFQVGLKFYLVFPLCTGGELYEHVIRRGHFSERDAAVIMRDLMSGLHALHQHDILHLDIKPENILFETDSDDSRIKITDFGLSKLFNQGEDENSRSVSVGDMAKKLKNFQESGVLQRDRLRGTVGYMSPELILAGVSSAATDVWAAGVVLYILLCGHPPFQSKSNREILERSAKGQYSLEGKEWEGVSDLAKDLVRRTLTVDPEQRITVAQALQHPWLMAVASVYPDTTVGHTGGQAVAAEAPAAVETPPPPPVAPATPQGHILSGPNGKPRTTHLGSALSNLSSHVKDRKMEKMAVSFTRLVSSLQSDSKQQDKKRMIDTLLDRSGNTITGSGADTSDEAVFVLSQEYKDALMNAFQTIGMEGGKLTAEQFINFMNQFAFDSSGSGEGAGGMFTGIPALIMCRFVDRDGDGFISAEDVFTSQALILQRSKEFLRVVFRLYVESVWYPGRQLNIINLQLQTNRGSASGRSQGNSVLPDANREKGGTIMEPPKYITGKHVAAVFERLGLDPDGGVKVFNALCEAMRQRDDMYTDARRADANSAPVPPAASPLTSAVPNGSPKGNIFLHTGSATSPPAPAVPAAAATSSPTKRNAALNSLLLDDDDDDTGFGTPPQSESELIRGGPLEGSSSLQDMNSLMETTTHRDSINSKAIAGPKGTALAIEEAIYSSGKAEEEGEVDYRMDFDDFVKVQQIDDVLVAALLKKPRSKMAKLFHGALGQDGQVTNAVTSEMVQQRIQDEMCAALNRQSLGFRSPSGRGDSGPADPSTPGSLLGGLGRAVVTFATGGSATKEKESA